LGSMPNLVHPRSWRRLATRSNAAKEPTELEEVRLIVERT
jgi:hypothetical protein